MSDAQPVPRHVVAIQQAFRFAYANRRKIGVAAVVVAILSIIASGIRTVHNGQRGVLRRFGHVVDSSAAPGFTYVVPFAERLDVLDAGAVKTVQFGQDLALITGDENLVNITGQIQYRVDDPGRFTTAASNPEKIVHDVAEEVLTREVSWRKVDDVLTTDRSALQEQIREGTQREADRSGVGMTVLDVVFNVVAPPDEARSAFAAVADANSERERRINEADGKAAQALTLAGAEADEQRRAAESSATEKVESARSAAASFIALADQARKTRAAAEQRLYREAIARFLAGARVIVLPGDGSQEHLLLDLKGQPVPSPVPLPPVPAPASPSQPQPEQH